MLRVGLLVPAAVQNLKVICLPLPSCMSWAQGTVSAMSNLQVMQYQLNLTRPMLTTRAGQITQFSLPIILFDYFQKLSPLFLFSNTLLL